MIGAVVDEALKEMENTIQKSRKKSHSWGWSVLSAVFASVRQRKWRGSVKNTGRRKNFCISVR